jgi:hypothetical protein
MRLNIGLTGFAGKLYGMKIGASAFKTKYFSHESTKAGQVSLNEH